MKKILLIISISLIGLGCEKDVAEQCDGLKEAVKADDITTVKKIVTQLAADLEPQATANDPDGHRDNYQTLIDRLNEKCDIKATEFCYGCIDTFPGTSEIFLTVQLGTHSISRVIDLQTDQSGKFVCTNMHE